MWFDPHARLAELEGEEMSCTRRTFATSATIATQARIDGPRVAEVADVATRRSAKSENEARARTCRQPPLIMQRTNTERLQAAARTSGGWATGCVISLEEWRAANDRHKRGRT